MNKNTRYLRKFGRSGVNSGPSHSEVAFEVFKGKECISEFALREKNPMNKRKSAWEGAGKRPMRERNG